LFCTSALAQVSCQDDGAFTRCSNGQSFQRDGSFIRDNRGKFLVAGRRFYSWL
jgi:hypothetical protein